MAAAWSEHAVRHWPLLKSSKQTGKLKSRLRAPLPNPASEWLSGRLEVT